MSEEFKKPIFIGKIGKIPKAITTNKIKIADDNELTPDINTEKSSNLENVLNNDNKEINEKSNDKSQEKQLAYDEPCWSGLPESNGIDYELEVLKSGVIIEKINLMSKKYWVIGRLPSCDIYLAHPTISRYHAILQYNTKETQARPKGFYIYDLGSTHGTFVNKNRIRQNIYIKIHVGHMIRFGNSTRNLILKGPVEDTEPESELTITEIKQNYATEKKKREADLLALKEAEEQQKQKQLEEGIDWGMGEDADEETDLTENPYATTNNEELYLDDPKKTLRGFFEREGEELVYNIEESGIGQFICRVELPVENANGRPLVAEAIVKGKKKEAVIQCALEACRILDRVGVLRQAKHESRKRKPKNWEEDDYCNSDDDEFFDRTGTVERKRQYRMKMEGVIKENVETYESLLEKEEKLSKEIADIQSELDNCDKRMKKNEDQNSNSDNTDSLDEFMNSLSDGVPDKQLKSRLNLQLIKLKKEHASILKLINIAKPVTIPPLKPENNSNVTSTKTSDSSSKFPLYGKRLKLKSAKQTLQKPANTIDDNCNDEEDEEKDDNIEKDSKIIQSTLETEVPQQTENNEISEIKIENTSECENLSQQTDTVQQTEETLKIVGPEKPSSHLLLNLQNESSKSCNNSSKRELKKSKKKHEMFETDDKYSMWLPPDDQKGDGKTNLNEKFGY